MSLPARLSPPVQRFVAGGLLVWAVAAPVAWVAVPLYEWAAASTERWAEARFEWQRARHALAVAEGTTLEAVQARELDVQHWLLVGTSEEAAATAFQERIDQVLASAGLATEQLVAAPSSSSGALRQLVIDWRGSGTEVAVIQALAALEQAPPLIVIDRSVLRVADAAAAAAQRAQSSTHAPQLMVELRLLAFWPERTRSGP